jgi:ABC-type Zn uptake system ZnuABC Zn-binding protein ZnuA
VRRLLPIVVLLAAAGCGGGASGEEGVQVVATTTQAADFARVVGGERVQVHGMLRPGGDPHDYEPRPSDVSALAKADVVVRSGGEVDEWLEEVVENAGGDAATVTLLDAAGGGDAHFWLDPRRAVAAVRGVARALSRGDPGSRTEYARRARAYVARLRRLDRSIARCLGGAPAGRRKVVTTHDAIDPFARRYGVEVVGTILSSRSTAAQPSARELDRLVRRMRRERVKAVLPESEEGTRLERAVAREAGAEVGSRIYVDSLAEGRDYVETMEANAAAIAGGC